VTLPISPLPLPELFVDNGRAIGGTGRGISVGGTNASAGGTDASYVGGTGDVGWEWRCPFAGCARLDRTPAGRGD
jgi:hypothetical protein